MDTVKETPLIKEVDFAIVGGDISSLVAALYLAERNYKVVLIVKETFLLTDLCTADFYYLENIRDTSEKFFNMIFNSSVQVKDILNDKFIVLHPDRLKLNAEDICKESGIEYIYGSVPLDIIETEKGKKILRIVGKFGINGVLCRQVLNIDRTRTLDRYMVNIMNAPNITDRKVIRVSQGADGSFDVIVRPGAYGKGHATLEIPMPHVLDNRNLGGIRFNLDRRVLGTLKWLKENFQEYSCISPGRSAMRGFSSSLDIEREIEIGVNNAEAIFTDIEQGIQGRQEITRPCNAKIVSHNSIVDYRNYTVYNCVAPVIHSSINADVVVVGGGTSGAMAAIYAARRGMKTVLVEGNGQCGGTGTIGGVSTYWFGKRLKDTLEVDLLVDNIYRELSLDRNPGIWSKYDDFNPYIKSAVLTKMCIDAGVDILFHTVSFAAILEESETKKLRGIVARHCGKTMTIWGKCIIDATGDGDIAAFAGADYTYGGSRDVITYWASLAQYTSPADYNNNFSSTVIVSDAVDYTRFIIAGRRRGKETFDHGTYVAPRESRHIKGLYEITLKDIVSFKSYSDTIYTCFSNYDPKGKLSADMVYAGVLPPPMSMEVPLRAILPVSEDGQYIKGLLIGGKAISCTHDAFPGMRMQPDLQHQGTVLGIIASASVDEGVDVLDLNIEKIQDEIYTVTGDKLKVADQKLLSAKEIISDIDTNERLEWVDLPFTEEVEELPISIRLLTESREEILPELEQAFLCESDDLKKSYLARFILWHGSDLATDFILEELWTELAAHEGLPLRAGSTICAQLLPDHGVMAEFVYKLNLLAWSKRHDIYVLFEEVLKRLLEADRDYLDIRKSIYHYVETFAYVAERTCLPEFIPMLKVLSGLPELKNATFSQECSVDIIGERHTILQLSIYRALARCGDVLGYYGLVDLLNNNCASIAISACVELQNLTGYRINIEPKKWYEVVSGDDFKPLPKPIDAKIW